MRSSYFKISFRIEILSEFLNLDFKFRGRCGGTAGAYHALLCIWRSGSIMHAARAGSSRRGDRAAIRNPEPVSGASLELLQG